MASVVRLPLASLSAGIRELSRDEGSYLVQVRRLRAGDVFVVFDPASALEAEAELVQERPTRIAIAAPRAARFIAARRVTLVHGLARADRPEQVLRAAVALGATRVMFVQAARSQRVELRRERLAAVMLDVARQCGRGDLPEMLGPLALDEAILQSSGERVQLDPLATRSLAERVREAPADAPFTLAVGPEGGFADEERRQLEEGGFRSARLGRFVLRTELAVAAGLSVIAAFDRGPSDTA